MNQLIVIALLPVICVKQCYLEYFSRLTMKPDVFLLKICQTKVLKLHLNHLKKSNCRFMCILPTMFRS